MLFPMFGGQRVTGIDRWAKGIGNVEQFIGTHSTQARRHSRDNNINTGIVQAVFPSADSALACGLLDPVERSEGLPLNARPLGQLSGCKQRAVPT